MDERVKVCGGYVRDLYISKQKRNRPLRSYAEPGSYKSAMNQQARMPTVIGKHIVTY
jgi:hypothetical protein